MTDRDQKTQAADEVTADFPAESTLRQDTTDTSVGSRDLAETLVPSPRSDLADPTTIGRYTIVQCLGRGGQGAVYRAIHPSLPIELAIKVSNHALDAVAHQALKEEAQILCELEHPHIARVRDLDFDQGRPFLVLDFIRGRSLDELLASGEPRREQLVQWLATIAGAIDYAHRRGILHLDLKPGNIVIDEKDAAKVIDFGMARMRGAWSDSSLEADGISGTLSYMSPEQAAGRAQQIGSRSDVFALGAILYRILTGHAPFRGSTVSETLESVRQCRFDRQSLDAVDAPRHWIDACHKAMESDPTKRFASAKEFADAIALPSEAPSPASQRQTSMSFSFLGITITLAVTCMLLVVFATDLLSPSNSVAVNDPIQPTESSDPIIGAETVVRPPSFQMSTEIAPKRPDGVDGSIRLQTDEPETRLRIAQDLATPLAMQAEQPSKSLRGLLRQTIVAEVSRTSFQADLNEFVDSPRTTAWARIQARASKGRETLTGVVASLDQLDSPFVVDEMETYRQLRLDLDEKARLYERLIGMDADSAIKDPAAVKEIADQYTGLLERLREHETTMQQFLQSTNQPTED